LKTQSLGGTEIDRIAEYDRFPFQPQWLFPNLDIEAFHRHKISLGPDLIDPITDTFTLSFHSFLIRAPGLNILVDTCNGRHKNRPTIPFLHQLQHDNYLENLARHGLRAEDINMVICTHLHTDHVGWNTRLDNGRWVPTFPNARYLMSKREFDHFAALHATRPERPVNHGAFEDSILPLVERGMAQLVDVDAGDHAVREHLDERIWIESAAGHTPGTVAVHVRGRDDRAVLCGDCIHHPIQFLEPELRNMADLDPEQAHVTRRRILRLCADTGGLLMPGHFPDPSAGRVTETGGRFQFRYVDS
jgi:glyoxylase-like metal-dependent hydrolase (beta-lactamase superfamily II)